MAKKHFLIIVLLTNFIFANTIRLPENFTVKKTLSGKLSEDLSLHLIFSLNTSNKQYTLHPYLFDGKKVEKLPLIENKKQIEIVSFHKKGEIVSVFFRPKASEKELIEVNINTKTNSVLKKEPQSHKNFLGSFEAEGSSTLLYKNKNNFTIKQFSGLNNKNYKYSFKGKEDEIYRFLNHKTLTAVRTDEFVLNGSNKKNKIYLSNKGLVFTKDSPKTLTTNIYELNYEGNSIVVNKRMITVKKADTITFKKMASYFTDKKVYQLSLNKDFASLQINDIAQNKIVNSIKIDSSFTTSDLDYNKNFLGVPKFLTEMYLQRTSPTITVNKTIDDNYRVRFSYLNYYFNDVNRHWWFFQQQEKLWRLNQKDFMINSSSFHGPNPTNDFTFDLVKTNTNNYSFEILISENGTILNKKLPETIYKKINKDKYAKKFRNNHNYYLKSYCFTNNGFRYMAYSKKNKTIELFNDTF